MKMKVKFIFKGAIHAAGQAPPRNENPEPL
jgi:hypothetical protein